MMNDFETRSEIKSRIMREAAREWGFKGVNDIDLNAFDPIIDLMIGACSFELEKLSHDISNSSSRIFDRMVDVLTPEVLSSAQPAYSIFHGHPVETNHITKKNEHFFYKSIEHKKDFFFTPLDEFKLVDAKIKTIAFNDKLYQVNERLERDLVSNTHYSQLLPSSSYFVGIEVSPHIRSLKDFTFYFDWPNELNKNELLQYITNAKWYVGDTELKTIKGHNHSPKTEDHQTILSALDFSKRIDKNVHSLYKPHFITIKEGDIDVAEAKSKYPSVFSTCFDDSALALFEDDMIWIEIKLPYILTNSLPEMQVLLNCFPIINHKLVEKQDKLEGLLHILPLELLGEYFVGIDSVTNSSQVPYSEIAIEKIDSADYGMYALRTNGVKRFDNRQAKDMMDYILNLFVSESSAFKGIAYSALSSDFKELEQVFNRIKKNVTVSSKELENTYFLFAKPFLNDNMIYLKYWTSDGDKANRIPKNSSLKLHDNTNYHANTCIMVTSSRGGLAPKNNQESIHLFKNAVLSHDRIVTKEDVKKMCMNEMGFNNISSVRVEKGILNEKTEQMGLRNCLYVHIESKPSTRLTRTEYQQLCIETERKLNDRSMGVYPIKLVEVEKASQ